MYTLDVYQKHLFDEEDDLRRWLPADRVNRLLRIRWLYTYMVDNPSESDRIILQKYKETYGIKQSQAYEDLGVCRKMLPMLSEASRDYHRYRYNEMIMETYQQAKESGDLKTMERCASSYARYNRVDQEDIASIPYDQIIVQPFTATDDPSVLGITKMPNLRKRIDALLEKYGAENPDIQDIDYEDADIQY